MRPSFRTCALGWACFAMNAAGPTWTHALEKPLSGKEKVVMRLSGGNFEVVPGKEGRIAVSWREKGWRKPDVSLNVCEERAELAFRRTPFGPNAGFHVRVEVPPACALNARLGIGSLSVGPVTGDKDIEARAGEVVISLVDPQACASVEGSVTFGDLRASALQQRPGGPFSSFHWMGPGRDRVRASVGVGSLTFRSVHPD